MMERKKKAVLATMEREGEGKETRGTDQFSFRDHV
jgi:hypothetical protein